MTRDQYPSRVIVLSWAALMALLGLTVFGAYLPLGVGNTVLAMIIAALKAALVAGIFMELRQRNALTLVFAGAGFFWLGIMLWLAFSDYAMRPNFPPMMRWGQ